MSELTAEQTAQAIKEAESIVAEVAQESAGGILALHGSNLWLLSQGLLNYRDAYIGLKGSTDALLTDAERRLSALQADARVPPRIATKAMFKAGYEAAAFPRDPEICAAMWTAMWDAAMSDKP